MAVLCLRNNFWLTKNPLFWFNKQKGVNMQILEAIGIIDNISATKGVPFLETLEAIRAQPDYYTIEELAAFDTVMAAGKDMFASVA